MPKKSKATDIEVVYRLYKHTPEDQFPGLYEVQAVFLQDGRVLKTQKVHEPDNLRISSAILSRYGGSVNEEKQRIMRELGGAAPLSKEKASKLDSLKDLA